MTTYHLSEIEQAISQLSASELSRFREWFEKFDAQNWDQQFEADVKAGKLDKIADRAIAEYRAGNCQEL